MIKRPKRMCDWIGARVAITSEVQNGLAIIPSGSKATVKSVRRGFELHFDACTCCGVSVIVTHVRPERLEIISLASGKEVRHA